MQKSNRKPGRNRPMFKAEYQQNISNLLAQYPWLNLLHFRPAPGHLALIGNLLTELKNSIGDDLKSLFSQFTLLDDRGRLMAVYQLSNRQGLSYGQYQAVIASFEKALIQSRLTCAICGDTREVRTFCRLHLLAGRAGLRYFDQFRSFSAKPEISHPLFITVHDEPRVSINDLPTLPGEPDYQEPLRIKLFDPDCLRAIKKRSTSVSKDQSARLTNAIECMEAAGADGYRSLGTFNDGAALVTEFNEKFPNFACLGELLAECVALSKLGDNRVKLPPVLLVGPAGVGKTEATSYLANALNIGFRVIDMASTQSACPLSGSDSMWSNSQEGEVYKALCNERVANPIILLDEIDKVTGDSRYDPIGPLYSLLELTTARRFIDQSLKEVILDASHINWIATANDISEISKPILSRFVVFEIKPPCPTQARVIAQNIYMKLRAGTDWGSHFTEILDEQVIDKLVLMPPRGTRVALQRAFGAAAKAGRLALLPEDIIGSKPAEQTPRGFGFMSPI